MNHTDDTAPPTASPTRGELLKSASDRIDYLHRLADALEARGAIICQVAAYELRCMAEGEQPC